MNEWQNSNRNLTESFQYDTMNRLTHSSVTNPAGTGPSLALTYDLMGNITHKSDTGTYTYGDSAHPYAVTAITDGGGNTVYSASYDANGNQTSRNGDALTWDVANQPVGIQSATGSSSFAYGPEQQRYWQSDADGTVTATPDSLFEVVSTNGGATAQYRHKIVANGEVIALHTVTQNGTAHTSYLHYDHLGSVDAITDDNGAVIQRMSFDAFGARRDPTDWSGGITGDQKQYTDPGFTAQEQLDNVGLVHMSGRAYDPEIGRHKSVKSCPCTL